MTRTPSGSKLTGLLTMLVVLSGLGGMLAYTVQKVRAVCLAPDTAKVSAGTSRQYR